MKQAILIASKDTFNILNIIEAFDDNAFEFYIHIDRKYRAEQDFIEKLTTYPQVKFVSRKYKVFWAGLSELKVILHLCSESFKNSGCSVFHLISGQDYPVKSGIYFQNFFKNNNNNYMEIFPIPAKHWKGGGLNRITDIHSHSFIDGKKYELTTLRILRLMRILNIKRKIPTELLPMFGGGTWWSLNRQAVEHIIAHPQNNTKFLKKLRFSFAPVEFFIHTLLMKYDLKIVNDSLRYVDWTRRNGNIPANLDMTDFEKIENSNALFARKFERGISEPLIYRLSNTIHKKVNSIASLFF